jgi:hypothetical protein
MKRHRFHHDGLSQEATIYPREALRNQGLAGGYFETWVPWQAFPDCPEEIPGMPVMSFKVRCQRRHHKILIWPNGRITLTAHLGKQGTQAAKVAEMMGQDIRCFEILKNWRSCISGYSSMRKHLPKDLHPVLDRCIEVRVTRRHGKRDWRPHTRDQKCEEETFLKRADRVRKQRMLGAVEAWYSERQPLSTTDAQGYRRFTNAAKWDSMGEIANRKTWSRTMFSSGIAQSTLLWEGFVICPVSVPPSTLEDGAGPCLAWLPNEERVWIRIVKIIDRWAVDESAGVREV